MKKMLLLLCYLLAPIILFFLWATYPWDLLAKKVEGPHYALKENAIADKPTTLTLLSWNIAYGYGAGSEGTADYEFKESDHFQKNLKLIADAIKSSGADVVTLQEIDFNSARSHHEDQLKKLAELTGLNFYAPAVSWRTQYVPFPYWPIKRQFGGMSSGGAILSRFPIKKNEIHLLAKPAQKAWWYNLFYLYRYFQVVTLNIAGRDVVVVNLHLEAFERATRESQARELVKLSKDLKIDFIAGDFNMLPSGAIKRSGFSNPSDFYEGDTSYEILRKLPLKEVVDLTSYQGKEEAWFTFPSHKPDRRLDYIYHPAQFPLIEVEVFQGPHAGASDHLPIKARFKMFEPEFIRD